MGKGVTLPICSHVNRFSSDELQPLHDPGVTAIVVPGISPITTRCKITNHAGILSSWTESLHPRIG